MSTRRDGKGRRQAGRRRGFSVESLERRSLLTASAETFTGPSLTGLITEAKHGQNTAPAVITKMVSALESQLNSGPLSDLIYGTVTSNGFISEAQSLETSFEQDLTTQKLAADFPKVDIVQLLKLQGENVVANLTAENQENAVGLIAESNLVSTFQSTIGALTSGPILAIGTSSSVLPARTKAFRNELNVLSSDLSNGSLTIDQLTTTLGAEAEAYRSQVHAAIQVYDPAISGHADTHINALENTINAIEESSASNESTEVNSAIKTFVGSVLDTTGLFGTHGSFSKVPKNLTEHPPSTETQAPSLLESVSGTTASDGTATLTATLTSINGSPIMGQEVVFTLDGAFAGVASTNFVGVATLTEVPTADAIGTDTSGVVASFATNTNFRSSSGVGNLTVNQIATSVSNVSGSGSFGGTDTLTASLTNLSTGQGFAGQTLNFSVDGTSVGTAVTNSSGVATLSGVTTTDGAGTDSGGVVASYVGTTEFAGSSGGGDLVVSKAGTTLSEVTGAAGIGNNAELTATLTSNVTNQPIANETISFTLDGKSVGTATTNSSGVATLTGVTTTDAIGTDTNGVVASFAGDSNYATATAVTGNLVVSQNTTSVSNISGTATYGGTATLSATLTNGLTGADLSGDTISFSLDGKSLGTATTSSSGVATLSGVVTTDGVGTDTNGIVASYAGNSTTSASSGEGNLVVSQAGTTLLNVSGSAAVGGTATLTATLDSAITSLPLAGQTISFDLNAKLVGTAVTNSNGVATLIGVANSAGAGTENGAVVATFNGVTDYSSTNATGNLVVATSAATLTNVTGNATFGGTATLDATLNDPTTSTGISGQTVSFSLDGKSVGTAVTNSSGLATLAGIATTDAVGTDSNGVVATFAGNTSYTPSTATGDLTVIQAETTLGSVGGTAAVGGKATLVATLTSAVTSQALAGQTVTFKLDGTTVGTATTNSSGVATLSNVTTSQGVGTDTNGVVASFAGSTSYATTTTTGNLVVSGVATNLGTIGGVGSFGGKAMLTATLTNGSTNAGISGESVAFSLDNVLVGTATTNSSGVATLSNVTTSDAPGIDTGGVAAKFAGDSTYAASNGTGNLTVSQAGTTFSAVSGTANGGTADLTATLLSSVTNAGISGQTVTFKLDGTSVGTAITNGSGVATLTGVPTSDSAGTHTGDVVVNYAGDTDYSASQGTGDLDVSALA
jgi:hypothetical protein